MELTYEGLTRGGTGAIIIRLFITCFHGPTGLDVYIQGGVALLGTL